MIAGWRLIPYFTATLVMIPVGVVLFSLFTPAGDIWEHLVENTLPLLLVNTFWLALGVLLGTGVLGVSLAWFTAIYEFPGRKFFTWALLLPLAIPAYVTAFVALGLFDFTGPVQTTLRDWLDSDLRWFPEIRGRMGVIIVMTLAFYPYVYLLARNAFVSQGKRSLEVAQSLGFTQRAGFYKVALPLARPWIAGGLMLVLMETLADFGTVAVFNYDTFTTAIYKAWFSLFSLPAASQLASLLIIIVFVIIALEQHFRARIRYAESKKSQRADRILLKGKKKWLVLCFIATVWFLAFLLPLLADQLAGRPSRPGTARSAIFLPDFWPLYLTASWAATSIRAGPKAITVSKEPCCSAVAISTGALASKTGKHSLALILGGRL